MRWREAITANGSPHSLIFVLRPKSRRIGVAVVAVVLAASALLVYRHAASQQTYSAVPTSYRVSADALTLSLTTGMGGCDTIRSTTALESATQIKVVVRVQAGALKTRTVPACSPSTR
jgi:hypothetical protein